MLCVHGAWRDNENVLHGLVTCTTKRVMTGKVLENTDITYGNRPPLATSSHEQEV